MWTTFMNSETSRTGQRQRGNRPCGADPTCQIAGLIHLADSRVRPRHLHWRRRSNHATAAALASRFDHPT